MDIESDTILVHKDAAETTGKIIIKNICLCYQKLTLSAVNKLLYTKFLSEPRTIKFYRESISTQTSLKSHEQYNFI